MMTVFALHEQCEQHLLLMMWPAELNSILHGTQHGRIQRSFDSDMYVNKMCGRPPQYAPTPCDDLLTLEVVSESRVTWATSVPICLPRPLCSQLRPDVRDRQTSDSIIS